MQKVKIGFSSSDSVLDKLRLGSVYTTGCYSGTCVGFERQGNLTYVYCVNNEDVELSKRPNALFRLSEGTREIEFSFRFTDNDSRTSAEIMGFEIIPSKVSKKLTMYDVLSKDKEALAYLLEGQTNLRCGGLTARKWMNSEYNAEWYGRVVQKEGKE